MFSSQKISFNKELPYDSFDYTITFMGFLVWEINSYFALKTYKFS